MKYSQLFFGFLFVTASYAISSAQHIKFSQAERTIIRLQDERRGIDTIARYLDSKDEKVAWRAAIALANIHDSTSRAPLIARIIKENRHQVIDALSFALGVLGPNPEAYRAISSAASKFQTPEIFIALGRAVPKAEVSELADLIAKGNIPPICAANALLEIGLRKLL